MATNDERQAQEAADALDALSSPTPAQAFKAVRRFGVRPTIGAVYSLLKGAAPGAAVALDDLSDVDTSGGSENDVLTQLGDGSFGLRAPSGGSSPIQVVRFPFAFNTPGLLAGVVIWTPTANDELLDVSSVKILGPGGNGWNGATPTFHLLNQGETIGSDDMAAGNLSAPSPAEGTHRLEVLQVGAFFVSASAGQNIVFLDATPLILAVDDGAGGDPGSTQGTGEVVLVIVKAA